MATGGDFYVAALGSPIGSPVHHFRIDQSEHPIEFASIGDMMSTVAAAFARGIFFLDTGGYLEMDDHRFADLAAELNPHVEWWASE